MSETGSESEKKDGKNHDYDNASISSEKTSITVKQYRENQKELAKKGNKMSEFYNTIRNTVIRQPPKRVSHNYQDRKRNKINRDISWFYWKKYVASAFWSQLSTPINLSITLMTALTTAQANAPELLNTEIYKKLTIATLILTVVNTFFKPHEKAQRNNEYMKRWNALGIEFEKVYYSKKNNIMNSCADSDDAIGDYETIEDKMNELRQKEGPDVTNFFTDFLHLVCYITCLKKYRYWVKMDEEDEY